MQKCQILGKYFLAGTCHSGPNILGPTPKFKILLPKQGMSHLWRTKTQGGDRFSKNRPFLAQSSTLEAG
jgi:hypothetical protein